MWRLPFGKTKEKITSQTAIALTEQGKRTAERQLATGRDFAILSVLQDHSPRTISEISVETGIDIYEVKERAKDLARQGYVRIMTEFTG